MAGINPEGSGKPLRWRVEAAMRARLTLAGWAGASLAAGILFYACFRTYALGLGEFTVRGSALLTIGPGVANALFGWAPTLFHTFAFAVLTTLALGRPLRLPVCAGWAVLEIAFELAALSAPVHGVALGTFDPADVAAATIGGCLAFILLDRLPQAELAPETQPAPQE